MPKTFSVHYGPATGGRPGEGNGTLPERSDCRFHLVIVAPHEALRRPLESAQYTSEQFQRLMADHSVLCSMRRSGNVWDNATMKSFFSSLKTERTARKAYRMWDEAKADVFDYVERFYNPKRRHSTIGYLSPMEFERKAGLDRMSAAGIGGSPYAAPSRVARTGRTDPHRRRTSREELYASFCRNRCCKIA